MKKKLKRIKISSNGLVHVNCGKCDALLLLNYNIKMEDIRAMLQFHECEK